MEEKKKFVGSKKEDTYSAKANELISTILTETDCGCLYEIPMESMRTIINNENPKGNEDSFVMKNLGIKNKRTLDSLDLLSKNFNFDQRIKVKLIPKSTSFETKKINDSLISKFCQNGVLSISKPIFDKTYLSAAINVQIGTCIPLLISFYKFDGNQWIKQ